MTDELTALHAENDALKRQVRALEAALAEARAQRDQAARALEGAGAALDSIARQRREAVERLQDVQREFWALQIEVKRERYAAAHPDRALTFLAPPAPEPEAIAK